MSTAAAPQFLTPPQISRQLGVSAEKIIGWIRRGELKAADVSDKPGVGRPRYRIDPADLVTFLNSRTPTTPSKPPRRRRRDPAVTEFF